MFQAEEESYAAAYADAQALLSAGDSFAALGAFDALGNYRDSAARSADIRKMLFEQFDSAKVGDTVTLGRYEQDNDKDNGPEPIQWLVLAREDDRLLVISRDVLDFKPRGRGSWDNSNLRRWLNSTFLERVFYASELELIPTVTVSTGDSRKGEADGGEDTEDQIFLLSIDEFERYFKDSEAARAYEVTALAQSHVSIHWKADVYVNCWWLRSPGFARGYPAYVTFGAVYDEEDGFGDASYLGVRPAMWIDLGELSAPNA